MPYPFLSVWEPGLPGVEDIAQGDNVICAPQTLQNFVSGGENPPQPTQRTHSGTGSLSICDGRGSFVRAHLKASTQSTTVQPRKKFSQKIARKFLLFRATIAGRKYRRATMIRPKPFATGSMPASRFHFRAGRRRLARGTLDGLFYPERLCSVKQAGWDNARNGDAPVSATPGIRIPLSYSFRQGDRSLVRSRTPC